MRDMNSLQLYIATNHQIKRRYVGGGGGGGRCGRLRLWTRYC